MVVVVPSCAACAPKAGDKADFDSVEAQKGAAGVLFAQDANDIETLDSECKAMPTKYAVNDENDVNENVDVVVFMLF